MNGFIKTLAISILIIFVFSCKKESDNPPVPDPLIDLESYVAVGNSLTAGYADGALYKSAQEYAYPNIMAQQFALVGGNGIFKTPIINTEDGVMPSIISSGLFLETKLVLKNRENCFGFAELGPVRLVENPNQDKLYDELYTNISAQGPFNNIGVPGIVVSHLISPGLGIINPYYGRFAVNSSSDKLLDEAIKVDPTIFSLWIGNNDILAYASSGGTSSITTEELFQLAYDAVLSHLSSISQGGVVANIPDISSTAYFTSIDYNSVVITSEEHRAELELYYESYNQQMEDLGKDYRINWTLGNNPMVIRDKDMNVLESLKIRQLIEGELVLLSLPTDSLLCSNWGKTLAIPDEYILTANEINITNDAVNNFNSIISASAEKYDVALIDFNELMKTIASEGITEDGILFTNEFIHGNLFSLDGLHLSPQGNALVANKFMETINSKYLTSIPMVNVSDYPPIQIP